MRDHGVGLTLTRLTKTYGSAVALDGIDLAVAPGEFMTLLGPSGSGKTTTLNLIAGFLEPDSGEILVGDTSLVGVPPYKRDIGVVFQNYALFPHLTVHDNVAYPLKQRRLDKVEIRRQVSDLLDMVGLEGLASRYPRELSGGQQQRVALARALVFQPRLLLLDEPLGALDKRLRSSLQLEIKRIHREVGVTFVFVTHDQEEALAMSDRIAVFDHGHIVQVGTATDLYEQPSTRFVADFLGESNILDGTVVLDAGRAYLESAGRRFSVAGVPAATAGGLVIRPERLRLLGVTEVPPPGWEGVVGRVVDLVYFGSHRRTVVDFEGVRWYADEPTTAPPHLIDQAVAAVWNPADARFVPV